MPDQLLPKKDSNFIRPHSSYHPMSHAYPLSTEAEQIFSKYYSRIREYTPDFADDLFREAVRCYAVEAHTAVCITCRAAIEESLKETYEYLQNLGHTFARRSTYQMDLESLKQWANRLSLIDQSAFEMIGEIQTRGNRSAHGPTADIAKQWDRRKIDNEHMMEPLEIWADRPDALKQLDSTAATLHALKMKRLELHVKGVSMVKAQLSRIPEGALAEGAALSYQNAWQFLEDAELLLSNGSFGHATALAMYALEEYAKSAVIQAMEFDSNLRNDSFERIALGNHIGKFMVALEAIRTKRKIEFTAETKRTIMETGGKLQSLKERGLYVDYIKKWLAPFSQDLEKVAKDVVKETRDLMIELKDLVLPSGSA